MQTQSQNDIVGPSLMILGSAAMLIQEYFHLVYQLTAFAIMVIGGVISTVTFVWKWQDRRAEQRRAAKES